MLENNVLEKNYQIFKKKLVECCESINLEILDEFEEKIKNGDMLEHAIYNGNYYGTLKSETEAVLESGKNLVLEIEVEGAMNVKRHYPDAIAIMLLPPSFSVQEARSFSP